MVEYIKKETLLKHCTYVELANGNKGWVLEKGYIEDLPTYSFPRGKGEWKFNKELSVCFDIYNCSKCGLIHAGKFDSFCPNCGADMRKERSE